MNKLLLFIGLLFAFVGGIFTAIEMAILASGETFDPVMIIAMTATGPLIMVIGISLTVSYCKKLRHAQYVVNNAQMKVENCEVIDYVPAPGMYVNGVPPMYVVVQYTSPVSGEVKKIVTTDSVYGYRYQLSSSVTICVLGDEVVIDPKSYQIVLQ